MDVAGRGGPGGPDRQGPSQGRGLGERRLRSRVIDEGPPRTIVLRFERGEAAVGTFTSYAREQGIRAARLHGIGAFTDAELGFLDLERKEYDRFRVEEDTEVLSLVGNLSLTDQGPRMHAHVTLGRRDGSAVGGHLFEGHVGATLELFVVESPGELRRAQDEGTGVPLLDL